jgi:DNA replication protein DnaC
MKRIHVRSSTNGDDPEELERLLVAMNLTVAVKRLPDLLREAQDRGQSYSAFLSTLLAAEEAGRFDRKLNRSLKRSHLVPAKSLDEFDFSLRPKLSPAAVRELFGCKWVEEGRSILCVGRSGTGKTHIARALGHAACMMGYSVLYVTAADMLDHLHASLADNTFRRVFSRYARVDVLVADELGYLPFDRAKADYLFRLVSARHPARPLVVAANTSLDNWGEFFPSKAQAIATIDRLIDRATILRFTGKGCRAPRDVHGESLDVDG